jgi:heptosyltransferase I
MKILIVKLSSIGDIIHTLPVLSAIRRALPNAEISWVAERKPAEILRNNPLISNLIEIDTKNLTFQEKITTARQQLRKLRKFSFDVTLDFQGLWKSATIAKFSKTKTSFGFSKKFLREPASRFLLTKTVDVPTQTHIVLKNLALAGKALKIEVPTENFEFPIFTEEKDLREAEEIISQSGENFAVLNPAGGWVTKLWHAEKFGSLADKLWEKHGLVSIVATAPNEKELAQKVLKSSKAGKIIETTPTLKGFYELAKRAKVYVGGDTGPTFLAIAAGAPIVGIFGPTEWWRNGSLNKDDVCVERTDIACRTDCHRRTCGNWICMDIEVETVLKAVTKRLESEKVKK